MQASSNRNDDVARYERIGLVLLSVAAVAVIVWLAKPVGMGVLFGVLFAFTFRPMYERLARRWASSTASLLTVLGSVFAIAITFGGLLWILVRGATKFARELIAFWEGGGAQTIVRTVGGWTSRFGVSTAEVEAKARTSLKGAAAGAAVFAQGVVSGTASIVMGTFFMMLTMFFILRRWQQVGRVMQELSPLRPDYTLKLLQEFRRVGRTTLMSTGFIGLLQGALAAVGYAIVGLQQALFLGVLTTLASLVPGVGTMLVWLPAGVALILLGHVVGGIVLLAWGVVILTVIPTYVIRPRLVGGGSGGLPALFTFISLFGGAAVFGLKGLILGPVLMALAVAVLRLYVDEAHTRRPIADA